MPEPLTIAAAARLCGCPRSTLQRAIRRGTLHLNAHHQLDPDELTRAGYLATAAQQKHATGAQQPRDTTEAALRDMQRSMERLTEVLEALLHVLTSMQQERSSRTQQERSRSRRQPTQQPQTLPRQPPGHYDAQAAVQRIRQLRNQGLSFAKIATQLTAEGIPTRDGGAWHPSSVDRLFKHPPQPPA